MSNCNFKEKFTAFFTFVAKVLLFLNSQAEKCMGKCPFTFIDKIGKYLDFLDFELGMVIVSVLLMLFALTKDKIKGTFMFKYINFGLIIILLIFCSFDVRVECREYWSLLSGSDRFISGQRTLFCRPFLHLHLRCHRRRCLGDLGVCSV